MAQVNKKNETLIMKWEWRIEHEEPANKPILDSEGLY